MVEKALHAAKARPAQKDGNFGQTISEEEATDGDIISFVDCTFNEPDYTRKRGSPLHAAVVKRSREGRVFNVWEAGADGVGMEVVEASYNMTHLREGQVRCVCVCVCVSMYSCCVYGTFRHLCAFSVGTHSATSNPVSAVYPFAPPPPPLLRVRLGR